MLCLLLTGRLIEKACACRARQIEDQNRQLAGHASRVEQQQADMALQLRELTQRLQQTTAENEQLSKEIHGLRNAVKVIHVSLTPQRVHGSASRPVLSKVDLCKYTINQSYHNDIEPEFHC